MSGLLNVLMVPYNPVKMRTCIYILRDHKLLRSRFFLLGSDSERGAMSMESQRFTRKSSRKQRFFAISKRKKKDIVSSVQPDAIN